MKSYMKHDPLYEPNACDMYFPIYVRLSVEGLLEERCTEAPVRQGDPPGQAPAGDGLPVYVPPVRERTL